MFRDISGFPGMFRNVPEFSVFRAVYRRPINRDLKVVFFEIESFFFCRGLKSLSSFRQTVMESVSYIPFFHSLHATGA